MEEKRLGARGWASIILVGLVGSLSWAIENNYINLWVYSQTRDTTYVTWMTVASALAATLTTLLMGCLSDRLGKRKVFIAGGYLAWGVSVFLFGLITYNNMLNLVGVAMAATMVGAFMVIADVLMTFFGSTANDAAFNSYVTDVTNEKNRGKAESVVSVMNLLANIIIVLVAGLMGCAATTEESAALPLKEAAALLESNWFYFFLVFGILIFIVGIISFFLIPKEEIKPNKEASYLANLTYGFRPSVVKSNKSLYVALLAFLAYNCAIDSFLPYWMIYFQNGKEVGGAGIGSGIEFYLCLGTILLLASAIAIVIGLFMDKWGRSKVLLPALAVTIIGFLAIFFSGEIVSLTVSGTVMMSGYLVSTAVLGAEVRDLTPKDRVGHFQGVRMIFVVLLPMIIGPLLSQLSFSGSGQYVNSYGELETAPNRYMFLVALGFALLSIIPVLWFLKIKKDQNKKPLEETIESEERID